MTAYSELYTILDYIRYATSCFNEAGLYYGHGTDNAWDEACALILHSLHLPHHIPPVALNSHLTHDEKAKLMELVKKRTSKRIPVPYLTHEAWFSGLSFYVDERVLIPRSPIAELIENQFAPWIEADQVNRVLDLCTGSGCIAIACAKMFTEASIDASDISPDALAVAKINILRHDVENQVTLHEANLFDGLPNQQYDIIVSNPPYVSQTEMNALPQEYLHEPKMGLAAGKDGLDIVAKILEQAPNYLQPHGILIVEVGNSETALIERYPDLPFIWPEFEKGGGGIFLLTREQLKNIRI